MESVQIVGAKLEQLERRPTAVFDADEGVRLEDRLVLRGRIDSGRWSGLLLECNLYEVVGGKLAGIGEPPQPALGTLEFMPRGVGPSDEASLWCDIYVDTRSFERFLRTAWDAHQATTSGNELLLTVDTRLDDWDQKERVLILHFGIVVTARCGAA